MDELTDYEINKRLAEIAGVEAVECPVSGGWRVLDLPRRTGYEWNPLHNWSQIGPLMERFEVCVNIDGAEPEYWIAEFSSDDAPQGFGLGRDKGMRRAIALAIIAAHEENNDD